MNLCEHETRELVIGILPEEASCIRLAGGLQMEASDEWGLVARGTLLAEGY